MMNDLQEWFKKKNIGYIWNSSKEFSNEVPFEPLPKTIGRQNLCVVLILPPAGLHGVDGALNGMFSQIPEVQPGQNPRGEK